MVQRKQISRRNDNNILDKYEDKIDRKLFPNVATSRHNLDFNPLITTMIIWQK